MRTALALLLLFATTAFAGPTSRFIWLPNRPMDAETPTGGVFMNAMRCGGYVPAEGITGATHIFFYQTLAASAGALCGAAIYDAPGSTRLAAASSINCEGTGNKTATVAAFDLQAGTKYNICVCGNAAAGTGRYLSWTTVVGDIARSYSGKVWRFAANNCDASGIPPTMTGSLTDSSQPPPIVLITTDSP